MEIIYALAGWMGFGMLTVECCWCVGVHVVGNVDQDPPGTGSLAWGGYPTTMWNQLRVLCWRAFMQYTRSPADVLRRILSNMIIGTLIGVIFKNTVGYDGDAFLLCYWPCCAACLNTF